MHITTRNKSQRFSQFIINSKLLTAQINNHIFTTTTTNQKKQSSLSLKTASLDTDYTFPVEESKYHAYFLIKGNEINGNEWGIPDDSIAKRIQTFEGNPFLITADEFIENSPYRNRWMHPNIAHFKTFMPELVRGLDPENLQDVLTFQNNWKVGDIKKVLYDSTDDYWKAIVKPLSQFENMEFPPFASPGIFKDNVMEDDKNITGFTGVHLAGLKEKPAYGSQAIYEGSCNGTLGKCTKQFSDPKSLFETERKLTQGKIAALLSTDNPNVNVVSVLGKKEKKKKKFF